MRYLFWNTHNNKNINELIAKLVKNKNVDIVILAEYEANREDLLNKLNGDNAFISFYNEGADNIYIIGQVRQVSPCDQDKHYSIHIINNNVILCAVHLPSRLYDNSEERRKSYAHKIINSIERLEAEKNISDTIIVGDFNSNPFEPSCIYANCFNAIPTYIDAKKGTRIYADEHYKMFYNPMWNLLGDFYGVPGTFYQGGGNIDGLYWHMIDQVIFRPSMYYGFKKESLEIITKISDVNLLDEKQRPNEDVSDHLPILFEIEEVGYEQNNK